MEGKSGKEGLALLLDLGCWGMEGKSGKEGLFDLGAP